MVNRDFANSPPIECHKWTPWLQILLVVVLVGCVLISLFSWLMPIEFFQSWALEHAKGDHYKKFEAIGRAEFLCWVIRFVAPLMGLGAILLLRNASQTAIFLADALATWLNASDVDRDRHRLIRWRTFGFRGFCIAWGLIALGHAGQALQDCTTNWPYYRFRSGREVLPNISDSNRDVIRYLLQATGPDAKIFIASDQKLYFLSYYLLPRRLYYKVHPDAEFVVAQPFQQRRMAAYQLSEIDAQTIDRIDPDFILEYFEHPDFVDRSRLNDDHAWLSFYRLLHRDPAAEPNYFVCLRRVEKSRSR